jgi:acetyltransferase-like isoleucine patch superfamily enzyme
LTDAQARFSTGRHTYFAGDGPRVIAFQTCTTRLTIGAFCSVAEEVMFLLQAEHHTEWTTTFPLRVVLNLPGAWNDGHPFSRGDITVGNDVWIGFGATILSGVSIGDGAVVAAQSVVTRDVPPYGIVAGNPATLVRKRFSEEHIAALLRIGWWEWPDELIIDRVDVLCAPDISAFVERFDPDRQ